MTFLRITDGHPYLATIRNWYTDAFPPDERRQADELVELLPRSDMNLCALISDNQVVGFISYWHWDDIVFVEHFAIDPAQRGKRFGQQALSLLVRIPTQYIILEVERPIDEISHRRIKFYERQGFTLNPFDYVQPPYQAEKSAVPMRLMSIPAITSEAEFIDLSGLIRERVYERFYT
ncbi:GNAT family N-acetyltransferase [Spirosoma validum]|uniref:GNAT family N-acetyltransferase n=1 Tax=Spirosoma validum TaxID=2771355 RepID=A0A927GEA4_9BACT|nr:GNAT family N-acetyltransferase [Spirosoma validum]MBD2754436.1 GNAT family N-acetyltransferase [Spirosoma validum]